jgi:hypothetical protein
VSRYLPIDQALRRARSALRKNDAATALAVLGVALAAILLLAFVLAATGVPAVSARPWFLGFSAIVAAAGLAWAARPLLARWTDERLARRIADKVPDVGDSLLSAVQLHRDADKLSQEYALSRELIDLHVDHTATRAEKIDPHVLPDRRFTTRLLVAGGSLLTLWVLLDVLFPGVGSRSRSFLFGIPAGVASQGPAAADGKGPAPRLGDVTVTYRYPDYTGKEPETFEGTDGNLKALRGTVAKISMRADRAVKSAAIVLNGKDKLPLSVVGGTELSGEITMLEDGSWTIEAMGQDGSPAADGSSRTIKVDDDHAPMVTIAWPMEEEQEVNELEDVDITWGAEDDYGLKSVELVWENHLPKVDDSGAPIPPSTKPASGRIGLASFPKENPLRHGDRYRWALATLGLQPGGYLEWWVEATDNDTIPGPNRGRSTHHRLFLLSSSQIHEKAIALQEQLLKTMIGLLGDHLEYDVKTAAKEKISDDAERFEGKAKDVAKTLDDVSEQMLKDPYGDEQVYRQILKMKGDLVEIATRYSARDLEMAARRSPDAASGRRQAFADALGDAIPLLEKDVLFLDKLIQKQRFDGARQELAKLAQDQKDLRKMLDDYKKGGVKDEALAKALQAKLDELQKRMSEIARKMASTMKSMPTDFDNSALQEDQLSQIQKAIDEGRMDDAAELTKKMLDDLDQMVAQMDQVEQQFNLDPETAKRVSDANKELGKIADEQKKILDDTNQLRDQIQKRQDASGQKVNDFAKKELEKVKKLRDELDGLERDAMTDPVMRNTVRSARVGTERDLQGLEEGLKSGELGDALSHAEDIDSTLEGVKSIAESTRNNYGSEGADQKTIDSASKAQARAQEIQKDLEQLRQNFEDSATPEEKQKLSQLGGQQQKLQARAQGLSEELGQISQKTPFVPGDAGQQVAGAANSMGDAQGKLKGGNAAGAVPSERQAMNQLGDAQQQMQGAGQGGKGQSMGMPLAQRMGGMQNRGMEGMQGMSNDHVDIPDGSQFRVPKEFREDILEAMKKPSPDGYKQLNQEYYERLIK